MENGEKFKIEGLVETRNIGKLGSEIGKNPASTGNACHFLAMMLDLPD
jgi:hypothetical protein